MKVAFDVDGVLINDQDEWNLDIIDLAREFVEQGNVIWVWSMGGYDYAEVWRQRLMKDHSIPVSKAVDKLHIHLDFGKFTYPDMAFDDDDHDIKTLQKAGVVVVKIVRGSPLTLTEEPD